MLLAKGNEQGPVSTGVDQVWTLPLLSWNGNQRYSSADKLRDVQGLTLTIAGETLQVNGADNNSATGGPLTANGIVGPVPNLPDQEPPVGLLCRVEYGDGASSRVVDFDWQSGSYNLPPCSYCKVSAVCNGGINAGYRLRLNAYVREGYQVDAPLPSATFQGAMDGIEFKIPEGARAVELLSNGSLIIGGNSSSTGVLLIERDDSTNVLRPPWSPVRFAPAMTRAAILSQFAPYWEYNPTAGMVATDFRCVRFLLSL